MRIFLRTRSTAAMAALVLLLAFQPMLAVAFPMEARAEGGTTPLDAVATPVPGLDSENAGEPLPEPANEAVPGEPEGSENEPDPEAGSPAELESPAAQSRMSSANDPAADFYVPHSITYSEEIRIAQNAEWHLTISWDAQNVDWGDVPDVYFWAHFRYTDGHISFGQTMSRGGTAGSQSINQSSFSDHSIAQRCKQSNGSIAFSLQFEVTATLTATPLYLGEEENVSIPCTALVTPVAPYLAEHRCGPGTDAIAVPTQPDGVTVTDSGWVGNERNIAFSPEVWAVFPPEYNPAFVFTDDDPPCTASVTTSAPESLPRLPGTEEYGVTVNYNFGNAWPSNEQGRLVIELHAFNARSDQHITNPVGAYTYKPFWDLDATVLACIAGGGTISTDVTVRLYPTTGEMTGVPLWTHTAHHETDCSVAVSPRAASYIADACGYTDDRIVVPPQPGISGHSITWNDNVATIEYTPMPAFEIVGGPFTVTIMEGPCTTAEVPSLVTLDPVCGIENDRLVIGDPVEGVFYDTSEVYMDGTFYIYISPLPGWQFPEGQVTEFALVDEGDCVIEGLTAPVHTEVCGELNDTVEIPANQDHVTIESTGNMATDGTVTVTLTPDENYRLPDGIEPEYVFVDEGDCIVTPLLPASPVEVCGPNNDIISIPTQPEGVNVNDTGWRDNNRVLSFVPADGYVFPAETPGNIIAFDRATPCEEEPVGTTLVVKFTTSDGGSIEGTPYQLYAPEASQVSQAPYAEGEIGTGNQIVIEELIAGTYRLVAAPEGYEPIDVTIDVEAESASEEHVIAVAALQPVVTPTPSPDPTVEPTIEPTPTVQPTQSPTDPTPVATQETTPTPTQVDPIQESAPVTGLPETGTGSGSGFSLIALAGLAAAMILGVIGNRRRA